MLQLYRRQFKYVFRITGFSFKSFVSLRVSLSCRIVFFCTVCSIFYPLTLTIEIVELHIRLAGDILKTVITIKTLKLPHIFFYLACFAFISNCTCVFCSWSCSWFFYTNSNIRWLLVCVKQYELAALSKTNSHISSYMTGKYFGLEDEGLFHVYDDC